MSQRKFISKEELSMMWHYLFYTFAIAWGTDFLSDYVVSFQSVK